MGPGTKVVHIHAGKVLIHVKTYKGEKGKVNTYKTKYGFIYSKTQQIWLILNYNASKLPQNSHLY